jgi:hypothetical protein
MSMHAVAYTAVELSDTFITVIECRHCGSPARLTRMLRDISPVSEDLLEVRLFECEGCGAHTIIEIEGK